MRIPPPLPFLLLVGCAGPSAPAPERASPEPPSPEASAAAEDPRASEPVPAAPAEEPPHAAAPAAAASDVLPRQEADELAALPPRELSGREAEERARRAFLALSAGERREVLDWFELECKGLGTFQMQLVDWALANQEVDPASWPELGPLEWYDPQVHAPAQPIARRPLSADAPEVVAVRNRILGAIAPRRLDSGWMYDWGTRGLVRLPSHGDPLRVFENGLLGMPPDWDLVEALVMQQLDDGAEQLALAAFSHAYTDRWGGVYPGVTLYDAHASRTELEMPDVDTLGLVHQVLDDWETWKAVIQADEQAPLYARVGELFARAHQHRGLRENLARAFLGGTTDLRDGYQGHLDNFHALWESASSTPATLRARLPAVEAWAEFLQDWHDTVAADPELQRKALVRRSVLDQGSARVRESLLYVLDQYGAFARIETLPRFDR
jgi:hypothetical protein